jgi:hypothetical protein
LADPPDFKEHVMTAWDNAASKWQTAKPAAIALAVGLVAGPLISNYMGWQVTNRTAQAEVHAGIVEQQAVYCETRARTEVPASAALDWTARYQLAVKWAATGTAAADSDVTSACARKLAT